MIKSYFKMLFSIALRIVAAPFLLIPPEKNTVLFSGLTGGKGYDYSCNPKYIYEHMSRTAPRDIKYIWLVKDPGKCGNDIPGSTKIYRHFTFGAFRALLRSKVIITNGSYTPWFPFSKKQYVINTWHGGGAYKRVEVDTGKSNPATRFLRRQAADNIDLFLASCRLQEERMIRKSYGYRGEVLRSGTPRNDLFVKGDSKAIAMMAEKVRRTYSIPADSRILLYAPTYRRLSFNVEFDTKQLERALSANGKGWVILTRMHRYQERSMGLDVTGGHHIDAADYPDMQELLAAADMLVTDYSSCVWDYSFLKKPVILFVPDEDEYLAKTGFYIPFSSMPYPHTSQMKELTEACARLSTNNDSQKKQQRHIEDHLNKLSSYESGAACEMVLRRILEHL